MEIALIIIILICICFNLYLSIRKSKEKIVNLEKNLSKLSNATGNPECSMFYVDDITLVELRHLKENGEVVKAVKKLREKTAYDLYEAKQYIDKM